MRDLGLGEQTSHPYREASKHCALARSGAGSNYVASLRDTLLRSAYTIYYIAI